MLHPKAYSRHLPLHLPFTISGKFLKQFDCCSLICCYLAISQNVNIFFFLLFGFWVGIQTARIFLLFYLHVKKIKLIYHVNNLLYFHIVFRIFPPVQFLKFADHMIKKIDISNFSIANIVF